MHPKLHMTRRELVVSLGALGAVAAVPPAWGRRVMPHKRRIGPGEFQDGVASGDPSAGAVTFWSRLQTDRPRSGARLVVAEDEGLRKVVAHTIVPTGRGVNGALKARIGGLDPLKEYFYVWESGTAASPIGRTRTTAPRDSAQPLNIAFSSCQQYAQGYYNVHGDAAALPELDLYLFLGDYIYAERDTRDTALRRDPINADDLGSYRAKYALYRSDPALRELHRLHPVAHIWDDHEIENNYSNNNPAPSAAQRAAGYRVSFEWMPRMSYPSDRHRIYKTLSLGALADVFLLDERQFRTGRNDGKPLSMLGEAQMSWLIDELKSSTAAWKVVANQVVMATIYYDDSVNGDAWDGFADDRRRLLGELERAGVDNVVFLTGDVHVFMTNLLASDFQALGDGSSRKPAAVEYVGGSVTTAGKQMPESEVQQRSPWNKMYDGAAHGYGRMALTPEQIVTDYMASDINVAGGATALLARFTQQAGTNQVARA